MIERIVNKIYGDKERVILQPLSVNEKRTQNIISNIMSFEENRCEELLNKNILLFGHRHNNYKEKLINNYERVSKKINLSNNLTETRKLLIGSYFSKEYSIETAALFNPSMVLHPNQKDLNENEMRFILSLRATGEGHISSIVFREGILNTSGEIKLYELSNKSDLPKYINDPNGKEENYKCEFEEDSFLEERVLFPYSSQESNGMEDVRFVRFEDSDIVKYYGTYTAYNGRTFKTNLIETEDFIKYSVSSLNGKAVVDKGMALFPQKINDKYYMIGRQDGSSLYLMSSDDIYNWEDYELLKSPSRSWDLVQLGNCGSPIKTDDGWLVITHAVGSLRRYVISAILLDLEDPKKIIGELSEPLIEPNQEEREGYVPNVVYSCGSLLFRETLIIPYAMSDSASGFVKININDLLDKLKIGN